MSSRIDPRTAHPAIGRLQLGRHTAVEVGIARRQSWVLGRTSGCKCGRCTKNLKRLVLIILVSEEMLRTVNTSKRSISKATTIDKKCYRQTDNQSNRSNCKKPCYILINPTQITQYSQLIGQASTFLTTSIFSLFTCYNPCVLTSEVCSNREL